eukprot:1302310-Rhodomonas_salina.2
MQGGNLEGAEERRERQGEGRSLREEEGLRRREAWVLRDSEAAVLRKEGANRRDDTGPCLGGREMKDDSPSRWGGSASLRREDPTITRDF